MLAFSGGNGFVSTGWLGRERLILARSHCSQSCSSNEEKAPARRSVDVACVDGQRWAKMGRAGQRWMGLQRSFSAAPAPRMSIHLYLPTSLRLAGRAVALRSGQSDSAVWLALLPVLTHYDGVRTDTEYCTEVLTDRNHSAQEGSSTTSADTMRSPASDGHQSMKRPWFKSF